MLIGWLSLFSFYCRSETFLHHIVSMDRDMYLMFANLKSLMVWPLTLLFHYCQPGLNRGTIEGEVSFNESYRSLRNNFDKFKMRQKEKSRGSFQIKSPSRKGTSGLVPLSSMFSLQALNAEVQVLDSTAEDSQTQDSEIDDMLLAVDSLDSELHSSADSYQDLQREELLAVEAERILMASSHGRWITSSTTSFEFAWVFLLCIWSFTWWRSSTHHVRL